MENYVVIAGSIVGLLFLAPIILGNMHRLYIPFTLAVVFLLGLNSAAPYSPEARNVMLIVHQVPETVMDAVSSSEHGLTEINSSYFHAFH